MTIHILSDYRAAGTWPAATSDDASSSGANVIVSAESVAGKVLQVHHIKIRNTSETATTFALVDTDDNEIFADTLGAGEAAVYALPFELGEGVGLSLDLSGANTHHWSLLSRTRDV